MKNVTLMLLASTALLGYVPGNFPSIITPEDMTEDSAILFDLEVGDEKVYLTEIRPGENGRTAIYDVFEKKDVLDKDFSCRNTVHEYGSGALTSEDDVLYFTSMRDNQIYKVSKTGPLQVTHEEKIRFAEPTICGKFLFAIFEDHSSKTVRNGIMKIDSETGLCCEVENEHDFYGGLTVSPDKKHLAFFTWDFPSMSWDISDVWKVSFDEEQNILSKVKVNKDSEFASLDPLFSKDNKLHYISDRSGYWNLYTEDGTSVLQKKADFSRPHWYGSKPYYTFIEGGKIAAVCTENAMDSLCLIEDGKLKKIDLPFEDYRALTARDETLYFIGSSPATARNAYSYNLNTKTLTCLKPSEEEVDPSWISIAQAISFTTRHGDIAHGFYYAPKNPDHAVTEKPPLMIISHGGPTGHTTNSLNMAVQFWTSRGFAVCDVNYSGSSGFGREYRNRLYKNWGVRDVDDCEDAALYLTREGLVDKNKMVVRGGSAGGYTTMALLTFRDSFVTGTSYFGVSDLSFLALDDHKFESRYMDNIVGKYPEDKAIYEARSPLFHVDKLNKPILLFQGEEDKIVPPKHSEIFYQHALKKGLPTAYLSFEGEGHGFRKKENIIHSLNGELYFYQKIFGIETSFEEPPLIIENL